MNNAFVVALITPKAAVARSALRTLYKLHINSRLTPIDRSKNTELRIVISLNTVSTVCIIRQEMIIIVTRLILRLISGMEEMAVILSVLEVELLWKTHVVLRDHMHTNLLL